MAEGQQIQYHDPQLEGLVQRMLDDGADDKTIKSVVQMYDDEKHPIRAALQGGAEGLLHGAEGAITAPYDLAKGTIQDAVSMAHGDAPANAKGFVEGLGTIPEQWRQGGVRERSEMVGNLLGGVVTGGAEAKLVPKSLPGAARTVGKGLQFVGEHPWSARVSGAGAVAAGVASGRPEVVAGGIAASAAPYVANKAGQALRIWGGESPAVVRLGEKGVSKLNGQFDEAMVKRGMEFADEQAAVPLTLEQKIEQAVQDGKLRRKPEGTVGEPGRTPSIRERQAAEGARPSIRVTGRPAADLADGAVEATEAATPPIHVTGKAATDLALGQRPSAPLGPESTLQDLAVKKGTGVDFEGAVLKQQMETENTARLQNRNTRVPVSEGIPASKSKGPMSKTPGLTRADLEEAGLNPDLNYKNLTPQKIDAIKSSRAVRHKTNYETAQMDKQYRNMFESALADRMDRLK